MKKKNNKAAKPTTHEQWIEIEIKEGKTVLSFYPPNDEFEKLRRDMDPQPDLIYRRLNFLNGVPDDFNWTDPTPEVRLLGGLYLVRMDVENWCEVYAAETLSPGRIIIRPNECLPRPEAFGPCPCPRCTAEREA